MTITLHVCHAFKITVREMLDLIVGKYRIAIDNDPNHMIGSADNLHTYEREYAIDHACGDYITSRHSVRVTENESVVSSCIILAGGGASGVHAHSAIIHNESCIVAVGPFMVALDIPTLELQWATEADTATCFGVYYSEKHQCFISHGELEIARVSLNGAVIWHTGGADIFTNGITIYDDCVHVIDFNYKEYTFDIQTGREKAA